MRIQHNITALNAHRNLSNNNSSVSKNLEKLSSGYRINRAGDDAAGLAISEKMRAQITGLQTAQKNAEDGVSLVQTAEGALTEVHSMLNRMVELATQSANGTYSESNREEMQKEIDALTKEIDRISDTSNFNGTKLFAAGDGKITVAASGKDLLTNITQVAGVKASGKTAAVTETNTHFKFEDGNVDVEVNVADGAGSAKEKAAAVAKALNEHTDLKDKYTFTGNADGTISFEAKNAEDVTATNIKFGEKQGATVTTNPVAGAKAGVAEKTTATIGAAGLKEGDKLTINGKTYTMKAGGDAAKGEFEDFDGLKALLDKDGIVLASNNQLQANANLTFTNKAADPDAIAETKISLHVGESSDDANTIEVKIKQMSSKTLKIDALDIKTAAGAKNAIDSINSAIDSVSSIRSDLGALQNRLEHTINNIGVQTENITAAESRIRDVDMAKEMMAYTKNNILVQASQAMLAQANQVPQGVLQLLQ